MLTLIVFLSFQGGGGFVRTPHTRPPLPPGYGCVFLHRMAAIPSLFYLSLSSDYSWMSLLSATIKGRSQFYTALHCDEYGHLRMWPIYNADKMWHIYNADKMLNWKRSRVCLFVCLFVCLWVFVPLENFSLICRYHHFRWRAANFDMCLALMAIEGSLVCHTYCVTVHPFIMVISEYPWHSHLLLSV